MKESLQNNKASVEKNLAQPDSVKKEDGKDLPNDHPHKKEICLIFIVNGSPVKIHAKLNWHLKKVIETVLDETGNEGRPLTDWSVKWNDHLLDMDKKIEYFNFPECAELFLSLNAGKG